MIDMLKSNSVNNVGLSCAHLFFIKANQCARNMFEINKIINDYFK
jgi:hypothetical protein